MSDLRAEAERVADTISRTGRKFLAARHADQAEALGRDVEVPEAAALLRRAAEVLRAEAARPAEEGRAR